MFGLDFLFSAALFGLPLAGLPILLHLLFRKKSPVIQFSTIQFIRSSMQRTAARRKLQRWLLLACRALLLLLLIWAIAQPARHVASNWLGAAKSPIAAIVIDSSYSMQLKDQETTLLDKADAAVQSLLRQQLKGARVALFRSTPPPIGQATVLRDSAELLARWSPLVPTIAPVPLAQRVAAALEFLENQQADQKWLFVLTDFQSREFPHPVSPPTGVRTVFLDLHSPNLHTAGITAVQTHPAQLIAGIGAEAVVTIAGRPGESRAVNLRLANPAGKIFSESTLVSTFDRSGHGQLRFPLKLPAEQWLLVSASLPGGDASAWDDARSQLIEIPPRRIVTLLTQTPLPPSEWFIKLALDPSEGANPAWPLMVKSADKITADSRVVVVALSKWPDAAAAGQLRDFAKSGGVVLIALAPGLEESWDALPSKTRELLAQMLPAEPIRQRVGGEYSLLANEKSPVLEGLTDPAMQLSAATVQRFVPMGALVSTAQPVLSLIGVKGQGPAVALLTGRPVGAGKVFTFATLPDPRFTNLATHPLFLPLLVHIALSGSADPTTINVELGKPIVLRDPLLEDQNKLTVVNPRHEQFVVPAKKDESGVYFRFEQTASIPGVYEFSIPGQASPIAEVNVQLPGEEAESGHRAAETIASGDNVVIARSLDELQSKFATLSEPQPRWSIPIALVLALLCGEALMGSVSSWHWPLKRSSVK